MRWHSIPERNCRTQEIHRCAVIRHRRSRKGAGQYGLDQRRRNFSAQGFRALLRKRPHQPASSRLDRYFLYRAQIHCYRGASLDLPPELKCESVMFQLGLPSADELLTGVNQVLRKRGATNAPGRSGCGGYFSIGAESGGLTQDEALRTLRKCLLAQGTADAGLLETVLEAKQPPCAPMDCSKSSG